MASVKLAYGNSAAVTITLASLASSGTSVAGRESTAIDNTTDKNLDFLLAGKIRTGTSPTANTQIAIYVAGLLDDAPVWPDVLDGTDSDETLTSVNVRDGALQLARLITVDATSDRDYFFGPISVASLFGGTLPKKFVVFVTHNTTVNLNATGGNHAVYVTPVYEAVA